MKRWSKMGFVTCMNDNNDFETDLRRIQRFQTDRGGELFRNMNQWPRDNTIRHSTAAGHDPLSDGMTEADVGIFARGVTSHHQAGPPSAV